MIIIRRAPRRPARTCVAAVAALGSVDVVYDVPSPLSSAQNPLCGPLTDPFAFAAHQNLTSVTIDVAGYAPPVPTGQSGDYACDEEIVGHRLLPARLDRPLGRRAVYNTFGGKPVTVENGRAVPIPAFVPPGYVAAGLATGFEEQLERQYRHGAYELDIVVGPPLTGHLDKSGRATTVGPDRAYLDHGPALHSVSWARAGVDYEVVDQPRQSHDQQSGNTVYPPSDVSPADLLRVARSLTY